MAKCWPDPGRRARPAFHGKSQGVTPSETVVNVPSVTYRTVAAVPRPAESA
jgi:hypothetical protein